jgi:predicted DNA-binding transcriptional regulator YafY
MLTILDLLQSRREVSGQELAQALEVEERSVRRYIMLLRDIGIPIDSTRGRHGGYSLQPGFRLPPLMFNTEEITAVMMGLMLLREVGSTATLALESAQAKIARVLPDDIRRAADAMQKSLVLNEVQTGARTISNERLMTLTLAVYEEHCLQIVYSSGDGDQTKRMIAPYGLVLHGRTWYVPAYCSLRESIRVFRLDRILEIKPCEEAFERPDGFDARAHVLESLARVPGTYLFEVLFDDPLDIVEAWFPPATATLEWAGERTRMLCYSDNADWMARLLVSLKLPFTVCGPDELREALQALADEILGTLGREP